MTAEFLFPGTYLYRTRIRTGRGLISYVWLEFAPLAAAASSVAPALAWRVFLAHWIFLGLYELGYVFNDRAATSVERGASERPRPHIAGAVLTIGVVVRAVSLISVAILLGAPLFAPLSTAVAALLLAHTWIGTRWSTGDARRWISFAWLAALKYLPAATVFLPVPGAFDLCALLFLAYGAGRVLEYALIKSKCVTPSGVLDFNAVWFLSTLALTFPISAGDRGGLRVLLVLGSHHLCATVWRAVARARSFSHRGTRGPATELDRLPRPAFSKLRDRWRSKSD